jgi:tRNA(Arg) A34 adenosine deaminase TadA
MQPRFTHRRLVQAALVGAALSCARDAAGAEPITQPGSPGPGGFIARAFDMRALAEKSGDQPYGAVVARDGRIIGQAPSRVVSANDPTAHAEMEAIRDAARRTGERDLRGAVLYSSSRPCPMCEAAAYWAGIAGMVHGRDQTDAGAPRLAR